MMGLLGKMENSNLFLHKFRYLRRAAATTWMTRKCMNIPMAVAMKVMEGPSLDVTGKRMETATATVTTLSQNGRSTVVAAGEGIRRNTITLLVAVEEAEHVQRVTTKLAAMICGDPIGIRAVGINIWWAFFSFASDFAQRGCASFYIFFCGLHICMVCLFCLYCMGGM